MIDADNNIYGVDSTTLKTRPSYVYEVTFVEDGRSYIGSRISSTFLPRDDLWVKYFTSSKVIKKLLEKYEPYSDSWDYKIIDMFETYSEAVEFENKTLRSIDKDKRHLYINKNFSAGGAIIKSNRHAKYLNLATGKIELFPLGSPLPDGYENNNQRPPSRLGFRRWINLITFEEGDSKVEDFPINAILKKDYLKSISLVKQRNKLEYQKSRVKHKITNGLTNKSVYTDLKIPDGWWVGETKFRSGMYGKRHSKETIEKMKLVNHKKGVHVAWNKGLTKHTSESLMKISKLNSQNQKGKCNLRSTKGFRKYYNIETKKNTISDKKLELPWKLGSRSMAMMTPIGVITHYDELKEKYNFSAYTARQKMKENPNEWYYLHKKIK